jgi:hypothetical protein
MKKAYLYLGVLLAAGTIAGCDVQRRSEIGSGGASPLAPSSPSASSLIGTWKSTTSSVTPAASSSSCTDFVWTITSQTDTDVAGTFTAVCLGSANITGAGSGHLSGSTVALSINGNGSMPGLPSCPFSLSGTGAIDGDLIRVPYSGSTCLGPVSGTQTLQRSLIQSPTPATPAAPTPDPAPAPNPTPPPSAGDVLTVATVLNSPRDLGSWPVTTTVTALDLRPTGVHIEFSKQSGADRWPDVYPQGWDEPLQYTLGMCMDINGQWYCSAAIQYWYGLDESGGGPSQYAQNWFYDPSRWAPMSGHQPAVGETVGFFACAGNCRNNTTGSDSLVKERTNVVLVPMPSAAGASFRF